MNWRKSDVKQRTLDNARVVWNRYVEKNRRDVEEKSEQLKSISNLSALIAGFAVVSLVELNFTNDFEKLPTHVSEWLISVYAASTALVVGLMLNSMVLCTFILSSILKRGKSYVSEDEEAEFLFRCRRFANHFKPGDYPPQPKRTFERHWENRCESSWKKAFYMFTMGVPIFLANLACCRVVEVFLFQTHKWTRQWYRIYQRISVGKNEQRLGMGNRQRKRREKEFEREEESETRRRAGGK